MEQTPFADLVGCGAQASERARDAVDIFVDGGIEVRFTPQPKDGTRHTYDRDALSFVASGRGFYRADDKVTPVSASDLCFAAAGTVHGFEEICAGFRDLDDRLRRRETILSWPRLSHCRLRRALPLRQVRRQVGGALPCGSCQHSLARGFQPQARCGEQEKLQSALPPIRVERPKITWCAGVHI